MTRQRFNTRRKWVRVRRGRPCPVCGTFDKACTYTDDGALKICARVKSDRPAGGCVTAWLHVSTEAQQAAPLALSVACASNLPAAARAPIERRHAVYATLLRE